MRQALGVVSLVLATVLPARAATRAYVVDAAQSQVRVHVGKAGAFSFAGHKHEVAAPALEGRVEADAENLAASAVALTFQAGALTVLAEGEPEGDAPKVQEAMRGPKVLDAARFPAVSFKSRSVAGRASGPGRYDLQLAGDLTIHGVTRALTLPVHVEVAGDTLTATGEAVLRHDEYGLQPVSVAGVVKVKNEIGVSYRIVAHAAP